MLGKSICQWQSFPLHKVWLIDLYPMKIFIVTVYGTHTTSERNWSPFYASKLQSPSDLYSNMFACFFNL